MSSLQEAVPSCALKYIHVSISVLPAVTYNVTLSAASFSMIVYVSVPKLIVNSTMMSYN